MNVRAVFALSCIALGLGGCVAFGRPGCVPSCTNHTHSSSSLVGYLYPNGAAPPVENSIPQLHTPLRVGLAFLPSQSPNSVGGLSEAQKEVLLERIRQRFASRRFVSEITVVPDYYLASARGFSGLEGLQRLYGVDVLALVSYDQVTYSDAMKYRSLAYLTIVGAFVVNGSEHDVTTLVDLAVVEPKTRSLILRAGGTDTQHGVSTLMYEAKNLREASAGSFSAATGAMIEHFDLALREFEISVRDGTARVALVNRDGSPRAGGGAVDVAGLLLLLAPLPLRWLMAGRRRPRGLAAAARR
jgi:rhombotail lipoprotein